MERMELSSIQLSSLNFAAKQLLDYALVRDGIYGGQHTLEIARDFLEDSYVLQIRSKFWTSPHDFNLPPVPLTWWDHFKRDAIPTFTRWFGLKVEQRWEVLKSHVIFPDVPQIPGGRYYFMEVCRTGADWTSEDDTVLADKA